MVGPSEILEAGVSAFTVLMLSFPKNLGAKSLVRA